MRVSTLMILLAGLVATTGCSATKTYIATGADKASAADAKVDVEPQPGENFELRLRVDNLLPPERLQAGAKSYAVWVDGPSHPPVHIGNLSYDAAGRIGTLRGLTPHGTFALKVTAESESLPQAPSSAVAVALNVAR